MATKFDRIKGALYGVAVGDALGGPLEFLSRAEVRRRYPDGLREMVGGGWLHLLPGETTDDIAMTLCVAEGIIAAEARAPEVHQESFIAVAQEEDFAREIGGRFIQWLHTNPRDVGSTCRVAISKAELNLRTKPVLDAWYTAASSLGPDQNGNGALMRCIFPGLFYHSETRASTVAQYQSLLTHSGHRSSTVCGAYARLVHTYVEGKGWAEWHAMQSLLYWLGFTADDVAAPLYDDWSPSGYVVETMRAVLMAHRPDFERTLIAAVNFGGDADTVGALAGGLAGAEYGFSAIPERWVYALSPTLRYKLDELARIAYKNRK